MKATSSPIESGPGEDHLTAKPQDENGTGCDQEIGGGHDLRPGTDDAYTRIVVVTVGFVEALDLVGFARKGAHHLHTRNIFLQSCGKVTQCGVHVEEQFSDTFTEIERDDRQRNDWNNGNQSQIPVLGKHDAQCTKEQENHLSQFDDRTADELLHGAHIFDTARD